MQRVGVLPGAEFSAKSSEKTFRGDDELLGHRVAEGTECLRRIYETATDSTPLLFCLTSTQIPTSQKVV